MHLFTFHQEERHYGAESADPKTYELVVNYRSHRGIVNCARSVIKLITLYWSHSIDILQPEWASVNGLRPIFFSSKENVTLFLIFLWLYYPVNVRMSRVILRGSSLVMAKGNQSNSGRINVNAFFFLPSQNLHTGLNAGILVRDNDARKLLKKRLGDKNIIM